MLCPVYGCKRAGKPFPRVDKFREHFFKHQNPSNFLCFIESCRVGPLTELQLGDHLMTLHFQDYSTQPHFDYFMALLPSISKVVRIESKNGAASRSMYALFHIAESRQNGVYTCPVENTGCQFRLSIDEPFMEDHIASHDLLDRIISREKIKPICDFTKGRIKCPLCMETCRPNSSNFTDFITHFFHRHSEPRSPESAEEFKSRMCQALAQSAKYRFQASHLETELKNRFLFFVLFLLACRKPSSGLSAWVIEN